METITTLLSDVVKKLGGTMLAIVVIVALFLGSAVYVYQTYVEGNKGEAPAQDSRTIDNSDTINNTGGGEQNVNVSKPITF